MIKFQYVLAFVLLVLIACSPKVTEPVVEEKPPVVERPDEPDNPCTTFKDLTVSQRDEAETAYVLYKDQIKLKNYSDALPLWTTAYEMAPASNGRIKYQFDDGVKIYKELFKQSTVEAERKSYVDKIMSIYDKRVECFGEPYYVSGRKAFDSYYDFHAYVDKEETYSLFKQAIDGKRKEADYFIINPFTKMLYDKVLDESISIDEGRSYALKILEAIKYGQENCEDNICEAWETISEYAPVRLEQLEGIESFYDCSYYEEKYFPQFEENTTDCDNINSVLRKLLWAKCDDSSEKLQAVRSAKSANCKVQVVATEPGPLRKGYNAYNAGDFRGAVTNFQEYVNKTDDPEKKAKYNILIAKIYYGDIKNFVESRKFALKAAENKPNWGEPYILIGKLYASSGPLCGPGRGWDSQIVTWPAIDKFSYAKKIDPSVATEANKWISTYRKYMPSKEDIFQRSLKTGQSFRVGCWIQENTTIRPASS